MKPLHLRLLLLAALWTIGSSASAPMHSAVNDASSNQVYYYWFTYPGDRFVEYRSTAQEIAELELSLGVDVDTNPSGGVLVERGYLLGLWPHIIWPVVVLYAHY